MTYQKSIDKYCISKILDKTNTINDISIPTLNEINRQFGSSLENILSALDLNGYYFFGKNEKRENIKFMSPTDIENSTNIAYVMLNALHPNDENIDISYNVTLEHPCMTINAQISPFDIEKAEALRDSLKTRTGYIHVISKSHNPSLHLTHPHLSLEVTARIECQPCHLTHNAYLIINDGQHHVYATSIAGKKI